MHGDGLRGDNGLDGVLVGCIMWEIEKCGVGVGVDVWSFAE
jgi:hypothetical protein